MKTVKVTLSIVLLLAFLGLSESYGQWLWNAPHIYNQNSGNVGIGINTPASLLHVSKNMVAPSIRIQNAGGTGGASFDMIDNFSGANWKFKATNAGGFKIRDHANGLDVIQVEPNSIANAIYIDWAGNIAMSHNAPGGHGLNVINYSAGKAAVQGMDKSGSFLYATGMLGLLDGPAAGLPVFAWNIGVLGIIPNTSGSNGAAVYGWNANTFNSTNYGGLFVSDGAATTTDFTNFGVYSQAMHADLNFAGKFVGRVEVDGHPSATEAPDYLLSVFKSTVTHSVSSDTKAVEAQSAPQPGYGYGVHATAGYRGVYGYGMGSDYTGGVMGVQGYANGTAGSRYGVYGSAGGSGTVNYGIYGTASGATNNWAGYFVGDAYVSSDLRIGTTSQATGYSLSVNGKVACEEVLVKDMTNWPDYVFAEEYQLMNLTELEQSIEKNNHLPGLPSAAEIEDEGLKLGDMQKRVIEKIEELTLYTIEQGKLISELQEKMENLEKENAKLRKSIKQ